jgi:alpha-tubulin suppressor-like RCC1 family protein
MTLSAVAWGSNSSGQLGAGYKGGENLTPVPVALTGVRSISAYYYSTAAWMAGYGVRAVGANAFGELCDGLRAERATWGQCKGLTEVTQLAMGGAHGVARVKNATVATFGGNSFGTAGIGTAKYESGYDLPQHPVLANVASVAAGGSMCAAILTDGTLVAWGENRMGQLGDGTLIDKAVPTPVKGVAGVKAVALGGLGSHGGHMLILLNDGTVLECGGRGKQALAKPVPGLTGVVAVAAGDSQHSLALTADGCVLAWGSNERGELASAPNGTVTPVPILEGCTAISAGLWTSAAIKGGQVLVSGWGRYGVMGNGGTNDSAVPAPVSNLCEAVAVDLGEYHAVALTHMPPPPAPLTVTPGKGSLTLNWTAQDEPRWLITWRKFAHPHLKWEGHAYLPPSTRSYTIPGLVSGQVYEAGCEAIVFGQPVVTAQVL